MANQRICSIPDCGKPTKARGWCSAHWERWKKYGNPETIKTAPTGQPLRYLNEILETARGDCVLWPFAKLANGYASVRYKGKTVIASRLVCSLAHGQPPSDKHQAAHSCGNGHLGCINPNHLEWKTNAQNQGDRLKHGTHNRGSRSHFSKITEEDARNIFRLKGLEKTAETARRYGISQPHVSEIQNRKAWSWLTE